MWNILPIYVKFQFRFTLLKVNLASLHPEKCGACVFARSYKCRFE